MKWLSLKSILLVLVALFLLFYVLTRPEAAANAVQDIAAWVWEGVLAIGRFFTALANS